MIRFVKYAFALVIAALLLSLVYAGPAAAQSPSPHATLVTAEQLYARGEYALAAQGYQQLADQGYADSALFYNMGLAYWMAGDLGRALWSFKSAQAIDPRDAAVEGALQEVRSQIAAANAEAAGEPAPIEQVVAMASRVSTINELAMLGLGLWFLFAALLLVFILKSRSRAVRRMAAIAAPLVGVLLFVVMLAVGSRMYVYHSMKDAVVVASQVEVTNGPGPQYSVQFALPSGAEVEIVETRGNWVRIVEAGNRASGWAPVEAVATVQPSGRG